MPPVNTDEMNRPVCRVFGEQSKGIFQEFLVLGGRHFPTGFSKLTMLYAPLARDGSTDFDIVRRVNKDEVSASAGHQCCKGPWLSRVTTKQMISVEDPEVVSLRESSGRLNFRNLVVFRILSCRTGGGKNRIQEFRTPSFAVQCLRSAGIQIP